MGSDQNRLNKISEKIIGCAYRVSNVLGSGFLEKVYENSLALELRKSGISVEQQKTIKILYDGQVVGDYISDLLVEGFVLVELKAVKSLGEDHMAQCLNYLKGSQLKLRLLINFGRSRIEIKRIVNQF